MTRDGVTIWGGCCLEAVEVGLDVWGVNCGHLW